MKIRYYDRDKGQSVQLDVPAAMDVVTIEFDADANHRPVVAVHVNDDAVQVEANGRRIGMWEYTDLIAEPS